MNQKSYRDDGARGALLDEYEKALNELIEVIKSIDNKTLETIVDHDTEDDDCRSIQTILTHVVHSAYYYIDAIKNHLGDTTVYKEKETKSTVQEYASDLKNMFQYTAHYLESKSHLKLVEKDDNKKILTRWNQRYDMDQLLEHAIMHILRHRRQIERFLLKLK